MSSRRQTKNADSSQVNDPSMTPAVRALLKKHDIDERHQLSSSLIVLNEDGNTVRRSVRANYPQLMPQPQLIQRSVATDEWPTKPSKSNTAPSMDIINPSSS